MSTLSISVPTICTKRRKVTKYADGKRKIQYSSNILRAIGFEPGTRLIEKPLESGGYSIEVATSTGNPLMMATKKVYEREYKRRRNNPFESYIESTSQAVLNTIDKSCDYVHLTMTFGKIIVKEVKDIVAERITKLLNSKNPFTVFSALSSGVDAHAAQSVGFEIVSALDYRPQESRDKQDFTETGMLSFLHNVTGVKHFFNEDIYEVSPEMVAHFTRHSPSSLLTLSPQCDDFSVAKSKSLKDKSFEDLSSTLDMLVPCLNFIRRLQFPMILTENVPGFGSSALGQVWDLQLRRLGYTTYQATLDPLEHEGRTSRKRFYHFATSLPVKFAFPDPTGKAKLGVWESLIEPRLEDFRDVSHSISIQKGAASGRLRTITPEKAHSPSILKSQLRMCKDSVVISTPDGRYLWPDEKLMNDLMGIPDSFSHDISSTTIASEIIGQSVDYPHYQRILQAIKSHLSAFLEQQAWPMAEAS
ncbi:DNA cytosine methyltransferase [Vibrio sp. SCSIO 43140]|uniref:DNA cytosine methyltransferase n=1 Tax=Vibrio sp. SCSIO 43140 TaxID=2819100 RepID=UPI002075AD71|nr:DNA cytosine methyltransferase [Vibrio sp. SCSIO 43140]USD58951.1 DNA cytosine methyltransferase [Vibrio sp. SCSIO 43140]